MVTLSFCQDSSSVRKVILQGDTFAIIKPVDLKTLNEQIALLSDHKITCDSTVKKCDSLLINCRLNRIDLETKISNKDIELGNKDTEIYNLKDICKNKNKMCRNRFLYGSAGGLAVGLIFGIIIAK